MFKPAMTAAAAMTTIGARSSATPSSTSTTPEPTPHQTGWTNTQSLHRLATLRITSTRGVPTAPTLPDQAHAPATTAGSRTGHTVARTQHHTNGGVIQQCRSDMTARETGSAQDQYRRAAHRALRVAEHHWVSHAGMLVLPEPPFDDTFSVLSESVASRGACHTLPAMPVAVLPIGRYAATIRTAHPPTTPRRTRNRTLRLRP